MAAIHQMYPYGAPYISYMSSMDAPPLARMGLPNRPWRKRSKMRAGKLSMTAMMTEAMKKSMNEIRYGGFRPMKGISLMGLKNIGPIPLYSQEEFDLTKIRFRFQA